MSTWYMINDADDVTVSEDKKTVEVRLTHNDFGNVYIEFPVEFVLEKLKG